jgi:flavin-dependent dehydrogenase
MNYDVIIVGARVAGASTALLLARSGYRVLVVDKATFPSDIMSGHFIHPRGLLALRRWGLLEKVKATDCPPITKFTLDAGPNTFSTRVLPLDGIDFGLAPRRFVFDTLLVREAVAAGAELREGFSVQGLLMDGDRVTGIHGRAADGAVMTEEASLVIGADGMHSLVARAVQAPQYHTYPTQGCAYYAYWSGVELDGACMYMRPGFAIGSYPTNKNQVIVGVLWPIAAFPQVRKNVGESFFAAIAQAPKLAERLRQGKQEERFVGTGDQPNFYRKPYGPGWALVGDAGHHKDSVTGHGMSDALIDAERLAEAIESGFSGRRPLEEALSAYECERNRQGRALYEFTVQFATLSPSPDLLQLLEALPNDPEAAQGFFAAFEGTIPVEEYYAPEHIRAIIAADQRRKALRAA